VVRIVGFTIERSFIRNLQVSYLRINEEMKETSLRGDALH